MNATGRNMSEMSTNLLPHQAAFVDTVLSPSSKRVVLLRADVGLGKTKTMSAVVGRLLRERPATRTLVVCPAALRPQWVEMLRAEGAPALLVDRYKYRELLEASAGGDTWPRGVAVVLSDMFAVQSDIEGSLESVEWDLLIADEAHRFVGLRATLLQRLGSTSARVVLATATASPIPDAFGTDLGTTVEWHREAVVDRSGRLLDVIPRPIVRDVAFSLSAAEQQLSDMTSHLCQELDDGTSQHGFLLAAQLRRSLWSSPVALESALRRLAVNSFERGEVDAPAEDGRDPEQVSTLAVDANISAKLRADATQVLEQLETVAGDSKLAAFVALLEQLTENQGKTKAVCVLTEFLATLYYLAAEIEGRNLEYQILHGGMRNENRATALRKIRDRGCILIATRATMTEGLDLPEVTDLILYDLPGNRTAAELAIGRFDRFGRSSRLTIHAFAQPDGPYGMSLQQLGL